MNRKAILSQATIMAMAVAAAMTSCAPSNSGNSNDTSADSCLQESAAAAIVAPEEAWVEFATDSITVEKSIEFVNSAQETTTATFSATVDYPRECNAKTYKALNDKVREFISKELLEGESRRITNKDVVYEAAKLYMDYYRKTKESGENDFQFGAEKIINISKIFEDKDYLTYQIYNYGFEGGAHGSYETTGVTFAKEDGSVVGWKNIKKTDELQKQITAGVASNYDMSMEEFMNESGLVQEEPTKLSDGTLVLPWPTTEPYLTKDGWTFSYQIYEIMSYADGAPSGVVARDKVEFQK